VRIAALQMQSRCANSTYSATAQHQEGKLSKVLQHRTTTSNLALGMELPSLPMVVLQAAISLLDEEPIVYRGFCHQLLEHRHEMRIPKFTTLSQFGADLHLLQAAAFLVVSNVAPKFDGTCRTTLTLISHISYSLYKMPILFLAWVSPGVQLIGRAQRAWLSFGRGLALGVSACAAVHG
jgi:hypothetical protein